MNPGLLPVQEIATPIAGRERDRSSATTHLSALRAARQATLDAEERFDVVVESSTFGIVLQMHDKVAYANTEAARMLKFTSAAALVGRDYRSLLTPAYRCKFDISKQKHQDKVGHLGSDEREYLCADGSTLLAEAFGRTVPYAGGLAVLISIRDIAESKKQEQHLLRLANFDSLTGLPNRHRVQAEAHRILESSRTLGEPAGFVFIDLDHFKRVNDSYGHDAGDELIREVACRLTGALREKDVLGRLGGDEFVVLLPSASKEVCGLVAARLLDALQAPFRLRDTDVYTGGSIGVAMFPQAGTTVVDLLKSADTAMYQAKAAGRSTFMFFEPRMNEQAQQDQWLATALRQALESRQFSLFYQPKICARSGRTIGFEALIRWMHPLRGMIPPDSFIPFAEESGLIVALGEWVIEEACRQVASWADVGQHLPVAVNISARQLTCSDVVGVVRAATARAGIDPSCLEIELTETSLVQDAAQALEVLTSLKAMGCVVYLDDFGTGYSSLSQLANFPIDAFKVDKNFIARITTEPKVEALVGSMVHIARSLGLRIVAEGVETREQLGVLKAAGFDILQGYLFSRPMPARNVVEFLASEGARLVAAGDGPGVPRKGDT